MSTKVTIRPQRTYKDRLFRMLFSEKENLMDLYSTRQVKIPTPVYVVFYNGRKDIGEEVDQKLSDAFLHGNKQSGMELKARVLNINYGHNRELMERCKTLQEYAIFVGKVKENIKMMELLPAINLAVDECIEGDVLREFLIERRADVVNALLTEYDEERVLADLSREFFEDGEEKGALACILIFLLGLNLVYWRKQL